MRAQKLQALKEERIRKQKEEARKIAPGFLDTDQRILTPMLMYSSSRRGNQPSEDSNNINSSGENKNDIENQKHTRSVSDDISARVVERMNLESGVERDEVKQSVY